MSYRNLECSQTPKHHVRLRSAKIHERTGNAHNLFLVFFDCLCLFGAIVRMSN